MCFLEWILFRVFLFLLVSDRSTSRVDFSFSWCMRLMDSIWIYSERGPRPQEQKKKNHKNIWNRDCVWILSEVFEISRFLSSFDWVQLGNTGRYWVWASARLNFTVFIYNRERNFVSVLFVKQVKQRHISLDVYGLFLYTKRTKHTHWDNRKAIARARNRNNHIK